MNYMGMWEEQQSQAEEEFIKGMDEGDQEVGFRKELTTLINKHSRENGSNTPDHILANFLVASLAAFDTAVASREDWYGIKSTPGESRLRLTPEEEAERLRTPPHKRVPPERG